MSKKTPKPFVGSKKAMPSEICKPTAGLMNKLSQPLVLSTNDVHNIEDTFAWSGLSMGTSYFGKRKRVVLDDESMEKYCPERLPNFFAGDDFYQIENLYIKMHFLEWTDQYFVFFVKQNSSDDPAIQPSFMRISAFELDDLVSFIGHTLSEIDLVKPQLIASLKHANAGVFDTKDENCWDPFFTFTTPSGAMKVRPYRNNIGSYQFKFWQPKAPKSYGSEKEWKGPTMTLNKPVVEQFLKYLEIYQQRIKTGKPIVLGQEKEEGETSSNSPSITDETLVEGSTTVQTT